MTHHSRGLTKLLEAQGLSNSDAKKLVEGVIANFLTAEICSREKAILQYAKMLTENPSSISVKEIQSLREHGLNDLAIHDLCAIVSYFAFVNRIADGLGVELESA